MLQLTQIFAQTMFVRNFAQFIKALEKLNQTILQYECNEDAELKDLVEREVKKFINSFGTHYQSQVDLKAK